MQARKENQDPEVELGDMEEIKTGGTNGTTTKEKGKVKQQV